MGWAKYYEDNLEIFLGRQEVMQSQIRETKIKVAFNKNPAIFNRTTKNKEKLFEAMQNEYNDRYIICKDCGRKFLFSAKSQRRYNDMDWDDPKRCKNCRNDRVTRYLMHSSF